LDADVAEHDDDVVVDEESLGVDPELLLGNFRGDYIACPVPATASAATSPPGTSGPSTRSSPRWGGHSRRGTTRHATMEALSSRSCRQFESDSG
jgi:hypothetical protein